MNSPRPSRFNFLQRLPFTREGLFWLLISLGMLVTGLMKGINLINLLACWMIVLILWNWWMARRQLRGVSVERRMPEFIFAQMPFRWTITISNACRTPAHSMVLSELSAPQAWFVRCVPPAGAVVVESEATLPRRGFVMWNTVRIACGYPVGLANVVRLVEQPLDFLVLPRLGQLQRGVLRFWLGQQCPTQGSIRAAARRQPTAQLEFHGLRTFRPGDSPRHIHWRTSARRGELMVREFEDLPNDNLILLVDPWTPAPAEPGANAVLERLLSLAATICWEWCRQKGDDFTLGIAAATPVLRSGTTGRELALGALQELARVDGTPTADWQMLVDRLEQTRLPEAAALVLTLRDDVPLDALSVILRRPVASVNVALGEDRDFFEDDGAEDLCLDGAPAENLG